MIEVYIPDENVKGYIETEMAHSAIVVYRIGGVLNRILMSNEDYIVLDEMFFDIEENE